MTLSSKNDKIVQMLPGIQTIHSEPIHLMSPFVDVVQKFADLSGTVALMSGGTSDCARHHILGIDPWMIFSSKKDALSITHAGDTKTVTGDPFAMLGQLIRHFEIDLPKEAAPIRAGLLGYLAYDLKDHTEELPRTSVDDLGLPDLYMTLPSILVVHDRAENRTVIHLPEFDNDDLEARTRRFEAFKARVSQPKETARRSVNGQSDLTSSFTRSAYMDAVSTIQDYIVEGHVYQVNMSQRFQSPINGDPFDYYQRMYKENPAPFFAYINAGDHQILSTSPERFILLEGKQVETRPIKGTRPRGRTPDEDAVHRKALQESKKDAAELSMIVDLLRNDIGKVCRAGTVKVTEHKRLEVYENVYHLVSNVTGVLDDDKTGVDLIRATFPGGSITGCPKIRAMEIIDELEPVRRHLYTGSIGYLSFHHTMDLSIAIRTATVKGDHIYYSVGGGIVYDSDPADEYDETLHKGRTLMRSIKNGQRADGGAGEVANREPVVWHNGAFKPSAAATVSCHDEGFLYGYGFFETIRVERGRPLRLDAHLNRFHRAFRALFDAPPPDVTWADVISHLIIQNGLDDSTAACKVLAAAGPPGTTGPGTLLVTVRPYRHRLEGHAQEGLELCVYPHPRESNLASHKTMNYLFYKLAGQYAASKGADEAIILNADKTVSETNTANLFCVREGKVYCPASRHALAGTMAAAVIQQLGSFGLEVMSRPLWVDDLRSADAVFITNALMGAVPVLQIDDTPLKSDVVLCRKLNVALLGLVPYNIVSPPYSVR